MYSAKNLCKQFEPRPDLEVMLIQLSMKFQKLIKGRMVRNKDFSCFKLSDGVFILLINVKMPKIVGISTFMSRINFVLSSVEHEKSFITFKPGPEIIKL